MIRLMTRPVPPPATTRPAGVATRPMREAAGITTGAARRPARRKIDGWLIVDKPEGPTSNDVVVELRRLFGAEKVGHGGTLDPLARGVLPLAFGEATKTLPYIVDGEKTYRFTAVWGEERSTDDREGGVTATRSARPDRASIEAALPRFRGEIQQVPPRYSAVKQGGKRAYALARAGADVDLKPRPAMVAALDLEEIQDRDRAVFRARTGKGVYIRAIARDLGRELGCLGHVGALCRLRVGPFTLEGAISLEKLRALGHSPAAFEHLLPVETALDDIPALAVTEAEARLLRNGHAVPLLKAADLTRLGPIRPGDLVRVRRTEALLALARFEEGRLRPVRIFNL